LLKSCEALLTDRDALLFAQRTGCLKVVSGRIPIPDLRIEYVNENECEIQRCDLELATEHYRPLGLSQKARAGFQIYARHGETDRLRRIRDNGELSAAILGF
jgi:hypothetical protein